MTDRRAENLKRLCDEVADATPEAVVLAEFVPLAVSFQYEKRASIIASNGLLSKLECANRGLRDAVDPDCVESKLGTENDVFTSAGTFRYRPGAAEEPGDLASGIGLIFGPDEETAVETRLCIATPFDSGGVFAFLRPRDSEEEQVNFVRNHELPVPGYRNLLAQYMAHCFDEFGDYFSTTGPNKTWPIDVESGDARRWTFEVRFSLHLSFRNHLQAVFLPSGSVGDDDEHDTLDKQCEEWEAQGAEIRYYAARRTGELFDSLEVAGTDYICGILGIPL